MRRPNILIVYTDQQRGDALGANGNDEIVTPQLDALAGEAINYRRFFVQNPVCMPSRASFLTGRYPSSLGIFRNGVPLPADAPTLPRLLRNYGYRSANLGKLHFLPHANRDHRRPHPDYGFDHIEISDEPGCYEDAYRAWVRRKAPEALDAISVGLPPAAETWREALGVRDDIVHPDEREPRRSREFPADAGLTHSAFVADRTMRFLETCGDGRPFLCVAGFYSPHAPWVAPREFRELYDPDRLGVPDYPEQADERRRADGLDDDTLRDIRRGYYAMVSEVDHHVGRILDRLGELGLADNTIVLFTSDHGEWLGEHGRFGKGYPAADCVSRVPMLLKTPGAGGGRTVDDLTEAVDVLPTLLELCGVPVPSELHGRFLPGVGLSSRPRGSALTEGEGWKALRTDRHRYVLHGDGRELLFDLRDDPGEYQDLAGRAELCDVLVEHRRLLARRWIEMERPRPRLWTY